METLKFRRPDNWHAHLRQDEMLSNVSQYFDIYGRVLCMGNTSPLIETVDMAHEYKENIVSCGIDFEPVTCIMLTQDTTKEMIYEASEKGIRFVKFIPVGTSTGAVKGLRLDDYKELHDIFSAITESGMHFLLHAELMSERDGSEIPLIKREEKAIGAVSVYQKQFPDMKITIEHVSTAKMIRLIQDLDSSKVRATIAPQHIIFDNCDVFDDKEKIINPHNYCLPVAKRGIDRIAVIKAVFSGDERFFFGADSAPRLKIAKDSENPPAGVFFGSAEIPLVYRIFEEVGASNRFEDFTSKFGAEYYGYPLNKETITLAQEEWESPIMENGIQFCKGGDKYRWKIAEDKKER